MIFSYFRCTLVLLTILLNVTNESLSEDKTAEITIKEAWVRASRFENSAAYMIIENTGSRLDSLQSAETTACDHVELHRIEEINDVFFMKEVKSIDIPANSSTVLKPSGMHIMLMRLRHPIKVGEKIDLKLVFKNAGVVNLQVDVKLRNNSELASKDHDTEDLNLSASNAYKKS